MAKRKKQSKEIPWPENAAKYAWASVIAALIVPFVLNLVLSNPQNQRHDELEITRLVPGILYILLAISGILAGIAALVVVGKYGKKRIMAPAITGIVLHVALALFLVLSLIPALEAAREAVEKQRQQNQGSVQDSSSP